jgi:hypothetical protein
MFDHKNGYSSFKLAASLKKQTFDTILCIMDVRESLDLFLTKGKKFSHILRFINISGDKLP